MKRFWVFVIICVVALGLGFTVFRFMTREEILYVNQTVYEVNNGENFNLDIVKKDLKAGTEVYIDVQNTSIVRMTDDTENYNFKALSGGSTTIVVTSNLKGFNPVNIQVTVGDGNYATPFLIKNQEQLSKIGTTTNLENGESLTYPLSSSYKLVSNIVLTGDWTPIGANDEDGFTGNFDFNGKTISNLSVSYNNSNNVGLFSKIGTNGYVKGANLSATTITANSQNVGTLAGVNAGTIESAIIDYSNITNTVIDANVGGLVGLNNGTILKSQVKNSALNVSGSNNATGGVAGSSILSSKKSVATIMRSSAEVSITTESSKAVGGVVGYMAGSTVENCYAGSLKTDCVITSGDGTYAGGIAGIVEYASFGEKSENNIKSNVADTYSVMQFSNSTTSVMAGIVGYNKNYKSDTNHNIIYGNYFSTDVNPNINGIFTQVNAISGDDYGVYGKTTEELKTKSIYYSFMDSRNEAQYWQFAEGVWTIEEGVYVPQLSFAVNYISSRVQNYASPADITNDNFVEKLSNADSQIKYILKENIYLSSERGYKPFDFNGKLTCPLDEQGNPQFKIYLEIISNDGVDSGCAALFKTLGQNASLSNIVVNATIRDITNADHVASLAAYNHGVVDTCFAENTISTDYNGQKLFLAGLIAENHGKILSSQSSVEITYEKSPSEVLAAGITSYNVNTIQNCNNNGKISVTGKPGTGYVSGIVGVSGGAVVSCANHGEVYGNTEANDMIFAGVVGYLGSSADSVVRNCANYEQVTGSNVAGLVGVSLGSIENCMVGQLILVGKKVAGLVYNLKLGYMKNSMTSKTNIDASNIGCGAVYNIDVSDNHTAYCEYIFSSCNFSGEGTFYYESASNIRGDSSDILHLVSAIDENAFNHCIHVARSGEIERQNYSAIIDQWTVTTNGVPDIEISDDQATGTDGSYSIFINNSYSTSIWLYNSSTIGSYIQVRDVAK